MDRRIIVLAGVVTATGTSAPSSVRASGGLVDSTVFNVKNFGAKADGQNDDSAAIQSAIDAAVRAGGGSVYLPSGSYKTTGIRLSHGVTLAGANPRTANLISAGDNTTLITVTSKLPHYNQGIVIRDLGLRSNSMRNANVVGLRLTNTQFSTVENVQTENLTWIAVLDNCESVSFNKIKTFTLDNGISYYRSSNCLLSDSSFFGRDRKGRIGVRIDSYCDGVELSSVNLDHCGFQMLNTAGGHHAPMSTFLVDVQVGGYAGDGFDLEAGVATQLTNCWSGTNGGNGYRIATSGGVFLNNCRALNNAKNGVCAERGNWIWVGGDVVQNGTDPTTRADGFFVAPGVSNWSIRSTLIGQYGDWANTQRFGINISPSSDQYIIEGNLFGQNQQASYRTDRIASLAVIANNTGASGALAATAVAELRRDSAGAHLRADATIHPVASLTHIIGSRTIETIQPRAPAAGSGSTTCIDLVFDDGGATGTRGNISRSVTYVGGQLARFCYDASVRRWFN